jgi:hypothetical protein
MANWRILGAVLFVNCFCASRLLAVLWCCCHIGLGRRAGLPTVRRNFFFSFVTHIDAASQTSLSPNCVVTTQVTVDIQTAITKASVLVKDLPADLRQVAFAKAFDALMATETPDEPHVNHGSTRRRTPDRKPVVDKAAGNALLDAIDSTAHPEIVDGKSTRELALRVLKAARDDAGQEWLTPASVCALLKDKFRISVKLSAVTMALFRAGTLVDRRKEGDGFVYRIMSAGEALLVNGTAALRPARKAAKRTVSAGHSTLGGEAVAKTARKPRVSDSSDKSPGVKNRRLGPKAILETLIASGYFAERRTIGDIIDHVEVKQARKLKATDLSPALGRLQREQKLDRDRNAKGQYEYKRHPKHA